MKFFRFNFDPETGDPCTMRIKPAEGFDARLIGSKILSGELTPTSEPDVWTLTSPTHYALSAAILQLEIADHLTAETKDKKLALYDKVGDSKFHAEFGMYWDKIEGGRPRYSPNIKF